MFRNKKQQWEQSDDLTLVQEYQREGNLQLLGLLYARYMELVYGVCLKIFRDTGKAEDAVMNIFEELTTKLKKHEVQNFKSWLHVLARNHCLMHLRKNGKLKVQSIEDGFMQIADGAHQEEDEEELELQLEALTPCLAELKEQQRVCVELFYLQKKSYKEIAKQLDEEIGQVRSNIQNGKRNLRICIEKKHGTNIRK